MAPLQSNRVRRTIILLGAAVGVAVLWWSFPKGSVLGQTGGLASPSPAEIDDGRLELSGDPALDQQLIAERQAQINAKYFASARAKRMEAYNRWHGTKASVSPTASDEQRPLLVKMAALFANDPPAPTKRRELFSTYFDDDRPVQYKCVGWAAMVVSATPTGNGWNVVVKVRPELLSLHHPVVFTPQTSRETWSVTRDGVMTPLKVVSEGPGFVFGG